MQNFDERLDKIREMKLKESLMSVYDYDGYTIQEILNVFFRKINEILDVANETLDLAEWLKGEGLSEEVVKNLMKWLEDGTFEGIINENLFSNLNESLNNTKKKVDWINPDDFKGTDKEKLQQAIDKAIETNQEVVLSRQYDITYGTLKINKPNVGVRNLLHIRGMNGGITKNDGGYMFTSDVMPIDDIIYLGDVKLSNLNIYSTEGAKTRIFDCDRIIRIFIDQCQIINVDTIFYAKLYCQTAHLTNNHITGGKGYLCDFDGCYDILISENLIEHRESVFIHRSIEGTPEDPNPTKKSSVSVRIVNNLIEGLTSTDSVLKFGFTMGVTITGNYFEENKGIDIDMSSNSAYGFTITGNFFHDTNVNKNCIVLPSLALSYGTESDEYTLIGNIITGGAYLFGFNKTPSNDLKITSTGNYAEQGHMFRSNPELFNQLKRYVRTNGDYKKTYVNGVTYITKTVYVDMEPNNSKVIEVEMDDAIDVTKDIITASTTWSTPDNVNVATFEILNTYATGNKIKLLMKSNSSELKMATIFVKVIKY